MPNDYVGGVKNPPAPPSLIPNSRGVGPGIAAPGTKPDVGYSAPRSNTTRSTTSSGSSGYSGSGSVGGGSYSGSTGGGGNAPVVTAPPPPPPMSITDWLNQDSTYQAQVAALAKALVDYRAQQQVAGNQYNTDFASRLNDLGIQKDRAQYDQNNDFASRGMYFSGLYGQDVSKLLGDFARQQGNMDTAKANWFANQGTDLSNFQDQQQLTRTKAQQDAVARRAAQYGIAG